MPEQTVNYQCPACNGTMHYNADLGKMECDFCGSVFTAQELEAAYAERQQQADAAAQAADQRAAAGEVSDYERMGDVANAGTDGSGATKTVKQSMAEARAATEAETREAGAVQAFLDRASWNESERAGLRTYTCSSCGAALMVDAATSVTECPYCGNTTVVPGAYTDKEKPEQIIPFKIDHDQAVAALKTYYQGKKLLPKPFASANRIAHVQGVYVPFWLYDARVSGQGSFEGTRSRSHREGNMQVTETRVYDVRRAGTLDFRRVPADSSSKMPDAHMDAIEPYDYRELTGFSLGYMPGYAAERPDIAADQEKKRVGERMENSMVNALEASVEGYDTVTPEAVDADVAWKHVTYALLPVWLLHTQWEGKDYLFAMNGQTGRFVGDLPIDGKKAAAWFLGTFALTAVPIYFFGLTMEEELDSTFWLILVAMATVIAGIVLRILVGEMRTAKERHEASEYVTDGGLRLSVREDRYVTTRVSRMPIDDGAGGGPGGGPGGHGGPDGGPGGPGGHGGPGGGPGGFGAGLKM